MSYEGMLRKSWRALTKYVSPDRMSEGVEAPVDVKTAPRGRGRPRQFDINHAITTAVDLFRARGYDRVTLQDLTVAMGINPPSFYSAFGNKALLFTRIADAYAKDWLSELRAAFDDEPTLPDALEIIVLRGARRFAWRDGESGGWGGCLILEAANNCSDAGIVGHLRKTRLTIAATLYRGISRTAPEHVVSLTDHVMTLLAGLSAMGRDGVGAERLVSVANHAMRSLTNEFSRA